VAGLEGIQVSHNHSEKTTAGEVGKKRSELTSFGDPMHFTVADSPSRWQSMLDPTADASRSDAVRLE